MVMILIKTIIDVLQQNAEWLCAVAITYFAWKQCEISKMQVKQDLRLKRLELANKLDEICRTFPGNKDEKNKIMDWLISNNSNFIFLLNKKDSKQYIIFANYVFNLYQNGKELYDYKSVDMQKYYEYLNNVDLALGSADYGINSLKDVITAEKGTKNSNEK
ncbi:MAG: hypothetical protein II816_07605 [Elusimicrobia bacterium]|nr:hypothetical protein [Elusimicrobiota bacterium]